MSGTQSKPRNEYLAPTTLAQLMNPPISAAALNRLLEAHGLQVKDGLNWVPTTAGEPYSAVEVMAYRNRDGTHKVAVRWKASILEKLSEKE